MNGTTPETQGSADVSTRIQQIAELAKKRPGTALTTLSHHIDVDWMYEAYRQTRKDGACGVDGQTAQEFAKQLSDNLRRLVDVVHAGTYRAPPVRRVHIPKADGKTRPLGIPTFEDKVLQRSVAMVLTAVYEQDFLDCSYGFRPGRSAHQALGQLWSTLMRMGGGWVLDVDIVGFFDAIPHAQLRDFVDQRIKDGVVRRMIGKWLQAGVMEAGAVTRAKAGSPQGGVVSPVLANIYLHHVVDMWFHHEVKPLLRGKAEMVRYADDMVMIFSSEAEARVVHRVLAKRMEKYGLALHPEKTRLVQFTKPRQDGGKGEGSFDFLGFTHFWAKSRQGKWVTKQKTAKSRFKRSLRAVADWCKRFRHRSVPEQHQALVEKIRGHIGYFGIYGNSEKVAAFIYQVQRAWRYWLNRRSQRRSMTWDAFNALLARHPLPRPTTRMLPRPP